VNVFTNAEEWLPPAPAPVAATFFCAVQCITASEEQSAEHSAAVLAAHATWANTDAFTLQETLACTVHVA
jgi:hypothetical protein